MGEAACLLDSNILLRMTQREDPHYHAIRVALVRLRSQGVRLCYTSQILGEFWNASTRPRDKNGLGLGVFETNLIAQDIEQQFELLPDSRAVYNRWRSLLIERQVKGVQVHDARLAASAYVHGVGHILTLNTRDFRRFSVLRAISPHEVASGELLV